MVYQGLSTTNLKALGNLNSEHVAVYQKVKSMFQVHKKINARDYWS